FRFDRFGTDPGVDDAKALARGGNSAAASARRDPSAAAARRAGFWRGGRPRHQPARLAGREVAGTLCRTARRLAREVAPGASRPLFRPTLLLAAPFCSKLARRGQPALHLESSRPLGGLGHRTT